MSTPTTPPPPPLAPASETNVWLQSFVDVGPGRYGVAGHPFSTARSVCGVWVCGCCQRNGWLWGHALQAHFRRHTNLSHPPFPRSSLTRSYCRDTLPYRRCGSHLPSRHGTALCGEGVGERETNGRSQCTSYQLSRGVLSWSRITPSHHSTSPCGSHRPWLDHTASHGAMCWCRPLGGASLGVARDFDLCCMSVFDRSTPLTSCTLTSHLSPPGGGAAPTSQFTVRNRRSAPRRFRRWVQL